MEWEAITAIATMLAAISAWITVLLAKGSIEEAKKAVEATKNATEAALLNKLLNQYASDEMAGYLATMRQYYDDHKNNFIDAWKTQDINEEVKAARRQIHWYYRNAFALHEGGYLSVNAFKIITNTNGYSLFLDVVAKISISMDKGKKLAEHTAWIDRINNSYKPREWNE